MITAQNDRKGLLRQNLVNRFCDLVVRCGRYGGHHFDIPDINPFPALERRSISVDVDESFGQVVTVFLGRLAQTARTVSLARPSPGAFIKRHTENGEIAFQLIQVLVKRSAHERRNVDKCGHSLAANRRNDSEQS